MKGGNGANEMSAVTLRRAGVRKLPENLTRRRGGAEDVREVRKLMKDGNGANEMSVVTLCSKCAFQKDEAENLLWM